MRIWGLNFGLPFDGIHPTENFSIIQGLNYLSSGSLKPLNFQHPTLYQYLITFVAYIFGVKNYLYLYLLARLISCLSAFLAVYFLYLVGKKILGLAGFALACASFLGVNLLSIKYAHYAVPDSLGIMFIVLSILFSLEIFKKPLLKNYLLLGLFCGLSIGSKFSGLISLGFLICAYIFSGKDKPGSCRRYFLLSLLVAAAVFFLVCPYHFINLKEVSADFHRYLSSKGYFDPANFKARGFFTYPVILLPDVFGVLPLLFALAGLVIMFLKHRREALLLFVPALIYLLIIGREKGGTLQNLLPLLPVFSIFAAALFAHLKEQKISRLLIALLLIFCLLPGLLKSIIFDYFLLKPDTRILAQEWLLKNAKDKSKIAFERYSPLDLVYVGSSPIKDKFDSIFFIPTVGLYPALFYKEEGYDYIVASSFRSDGYQFFCKTEDRCEEAKNYATYDAQLRLIARFDAPALFKTTGYSLPWGTWPHNPTVKVYQVGTK